MDQNRIDSLGALIAQSATTQPREQASKQIDYQEKALEYLSDILDAKEAMFAAGVAQSDFATMFREFATRIPQQAAPEAPASEQQAIQITEADMEAANVAYWRERAEKAEAISHAATTASAPNCTCPSGDGSLRWPCPQHPPEATTASAPVDLILHCPACHLQHVDGPDERTPDWQNPPHRSHLCHGCGYIWRPADVPTEGVKAIQTRGKNDSPAPEAPQPSTRSVLRKLVAIGSKRALTADEIAHYTKMIDGMEAARGLTVAPEAPTDGLSSTEKALAEPLFNECRGIMGTVNWAQDDALRRALLRFAAGYRPRNAKPAAATASAACPSCNDVGWPDGKGGLMVCPTCNRESTTKSTTASAGYSKEWCERMAEKELAFDGNIEAGATTASARYGITTCGKCGWRMDSADYCGEPQCPACAPAPSPTASASGEREAAFDEVAKLCQDQFDFYKKNNRMDLASVVDVLMKRFLYTKGRAPAPSRNAAPVGPALREITRAVVERLGWAINGTFVVTKSGDNLHTADAISFVHATLTQQSAAQALVRPLDDPKMAAYLRNEPWISAYIETLECELRKAQAKPVASAAYWSTVGSSGWEFKWLGEKPKNGMRVDLFAGQAAHVGEDAERDAALRQRVLDAWTNYERMGEVCSFEGNPMIYASTLEELASLAIVAALAATEKKEQK